jgi:hypothetical protein
MAPPSPRTRPPPPLPAATSRGAAGVLKQSLSTTASAARGLRLRADMRRTPPPQPTPRAAVVACMDSRLKIFGLLSIGDDEAQVIRNADAVGGAGVHRRGAGRPRVDRPGQGQPVPPAHRQDPWLCLRRSHGQAQQGALTQRLAAYLALPATTPARPLSAAGVTVGSRKRPGHLLRCWAP